MKNTYFVALSAIFLLNPSESYAADFSYQRMENGDLVLEMRGQINAGDASKLKTLIANTTGSYLDSPAFLVDSPGGDVNEAIAIADLIRQSGEPVWVNAGAECASACFLIYASAPLRAGSGDVIIHRPYFDMTKITGESEAIASEAYQKSIISLRVFLQSRAIPDDLIDKMMQKTSNDGYLLTYPDKIRMGFMSPSITEVAIQKCGLHEKAAIFEPENNSVKACVFTYLAQTKLDYLVNLRQAALSPQEIRNDKQQSDALAAVLKKLKKSDPNFDQKKDRFYPQVAHIMETFPPEEWVEQIESAYKRL